MNLTFRGRQVACIREAEDEALGGVWLAGLQSLSPTSADLKPREMKLCDIFSPANFLALISYLKRKYVNKFRIALVYVQ